MEATLHPTQAENLRDLGPLSITYAPFEGDLSHKYAEGGDAAGGREPPEHMAYARR